MSVTMSDEVRARECNLRSTSERHIVVTHIIFVFDVLYYYYVRHTT